RAASARRKAIAGPRVKPLPKAQRGCATVRSGQTIRKPEPFEQPGRGESNQVRNATVPGGHERDRRGLMRLSALRLMIDGNRQVAVRAQREQAILANPCWQYRAQEPADRFAPCGPDWSGGQREGGGVGQQGQERSEIAALPARDVPPQQIIV